MFTFIRVLRVFVGLVAVWQVLGLAPTLTWLPALHLVTTEMWMFFFIKISAMLLCGGAYFWLGKIKNRFNSFEKPASEGRIISLTIFALISLGVVLAIVIPAISKRSNESPSISIRSLTSPESISASEVNKNSELPIYESQGWTQESTQSTESGPWLDYDPPGTRYYRDANRIIYRLFPPGVQPARENANLLGLRNSMDQPPP